MILTRLADETVTDKKGYNPSSCSIINTVQVLKLENLLGGSARE